MGTWKYWITKSVGDGVDICWRCIGHRGVPYATYGSSNEVAYGASRLLPASEARPLFRYKCSVRVGNLIWCAVSRDLA